MPVLSQSDIISGAVGRALADVKTQLASINMKLEKLTSSQEECTVSNKGVTLHSKGKMVWWTKSNDASCYRLKLYLRNDEIDIIEVERNKAYHTFNDLNSHLSYEVKFEIEDRNGKIINEMFIKI